MLVGWILSIYARKGVLAALRRLQGISEGAAILTARIVRYAVLLLGIGTAFAFLGASIQPFLAVGLIVAAVIFLALRGISANFAAGIVLQTRHPLKVGDEIEAGDYIGRVRELNGRSVVITTRDGRTVHVPNSLLLEEPLVNHSELGRRRSEVQVRFRSTTPLAAVTDVALTALGTVAGLRPEHPPAVIVRTIEPERISLTVQFWHAPADDVAATSRVVAALGAALTDAGVDAVVTSEKPVEPLTPPPPL